MPIPFARQEFVKRSQGRNAVQKSAYISRDCLEFEGNCALAPSVYDYSFHKEPAYREVLLPDWVDEKFKDAQLLWNTAERAETRKNSQVATDNVVALPDEEEVTLEMKIQIAKAIAKECFTDHGLGVEAAIHFPTKHAEGEKVSGTIVELKDGKYGIRINGESRVIPLTEEELKKYDISESNWHLHLLGTTRRFHENGKEFGEKARDIMPQIRNFRIVSGCDLLPQCVAITNRVLKEMGLSLRVELPSLIPQKHLGPVRMRGDCTELMEVQQERKELNAELAKNPENILIAISERQSIFTEEDVERYISKHTPESHIEHVRENFWKLPDLIQLRDKETHKPLALFSTREVIEEERKIMRLAERVNKNELYEVRSKIAEQFSKGLNTEQNKAYFSILKGSGISVLHGYAGTGKSYVLKALDSAYGASGVTVRAIGADNGAAEALRDKGISDVQNIHYFLHSVNNYKTLVPDKKEVWILDEAGKLGNELLLEFLKTVQKYKAKLIISGDPAQLAAIQRGGMFKVLSEEFPSTKLVEIQRQKDREDVEIVKALAKGNTDYAFDLMNKKGTIRWSETKKEAIESLVRDWAIENKPQKGECPPAEKSIIITGTNAEMRTLNSLVRETRKSWGVLGDEDIQCRTGYGTFAISKNDLICFRGNCGKVRVKNGMRGTVIEASAGQLSVSIKGKGKQERIVQFNPKVYKDFHLGYATNTDLSQGGSWEKGYVLDSTRNNRESFYVNFSRHIESCKFYTAKTESPCLSALKLRAMRSGEKLTSWEHTDTDQIEKRKAVYERQQKLSGMKASDNFKTRKKGQFLYFSDAVKDRLRGFYDNISDRQKKEAVYDYKNRQIFKTSPSVDVAAVSSKLSEMGTQTPFLEEKLLKELDTEVLEDFHDRFFEVAAKASNLELKLKIEAKEKGVSPKELDSYWEKIKSYQEKYAIGKIFVEGCNYQKLPIAKEWGADVERTFLQAERRFIDSYTPKDFFLKEGKTALNKAWEKNHFDSRRVLKYCKAEAMILEIREEDTKGFARGRQLAFEGKWYAYSSLLEREGKTSQEAIFGVSELSEKTESNLTIKGIDPLKNAVESFLESTAPSVTLFKDDFKTEETPLKEAENSYRHCLNEIGVLRREIAWQAASLGTTDFKKCEAFEYLEEQFAKREGYALDCLVQIESRHYDVDEVLEERFANQIGYQTARFEQNFQLSDLRAEESKKELSKETREAIKGYEEISILALQLKRACTVEALAQGKEIGESEDVKLFYEAGEARRGVAAILLKEIEREGQKHFTEEGKQEIFKATLSLEKQDLIADYEKKNQDCLRLWKRKDSEEYKQADKERTRSATLLSGVLSNQEKQKIFNKEEAYFFEQACQKEVAQKNTFELAAERFLNTQHEPRIAQGQVEMEEKGETKEAKIKAEYSRWYKEAGRLGKIIGEERKTSGDIRKCAHFEEFNAACTNRNKAAFAARNFFDRELESVYGGKASYFIRSQAAKHEQVEMRAREKQLVSDPKEFGNFLSRNTEQIIEKLFPEGATTTSEKGWRFGEKGSLSVKKDGYFFDFEAQEGGGLLKLIQREMGTDKKGAINWVKDTLDGFPTTTSLKRIEKEPPRQATQKEEKWISLNPTMDTSSPKRRASKDGFVETSRHAYRDNDGKLLYYSVRMENREGSKRVVPLSFGYEEGKENKPFWRMKAYDFGERKRTLYNLQCLKENPLAPVVVVEGEKTADAAPRALKEMGRGDYIAVSWSGGARSVNKTDWSPLMGREVLIWPDNDEAGKSAGDFIEKELFSVKTKEQEIRRIDQNWLERSFPKKWDLADALPRGLNKQELKERSRGYNIGKIPDRFEYLSGLRNKPLGERLMNSDIAALFIEGNRDQILKEISPLTSKSMQDDVFRTKAEELKTLLNKEAGLIKKLGQDHHINASGQLQKDLARQCLLFEARNGREPCLSEVLKMRDVIDHVGKMNIYTGEKGSALKCAHQRALAKICSNPTEHEPTSINKEAFCKQLQAETKQIVSYQQKEFEVQKQVQLQRQEEMNKGFGL